MNDDQFFMHGNVNETMLEAFTNFFDRPGMKTLMFNSNGGDQKIGIEMQRMIEKDRNNFRSVNLGVVGSAALYPFVSCKERLATKHSAFLFHSTRLVIEITVIDQDRVTGEVIERQKFPLMSYLNQDQTKYWIAMHHADNLISGKMSPKAFDILIDGALERFNDRQEEQDLNEAIIKKYTKIPKNVMSNARLHDIYFGSEKALGWGVIDGIRGLKSI